MATLKSRKRLVQVLKLRATGALCNNVFMWKCAGESKDIRESITMVPCHPIPLPPKWKSFALKMPGVS